RPTWLSVLSRLRLVETEERVQRVVERVDAGRRRTDPLRLYPGRLRGPRRRRSLLLRLRGEGLDLRVALLLELLCERAFAPLEEALRGVHRLLDLLVRHVGLAGFRAVLVDLGDDEPFDQLQIVADEPRRFAEPRDRGGDLLGPRLDALGLHLHAAEFRLALLMPELLLTDEEVALLLVLGETNGSLVGPLEDLRPRERDLDQELLGALVVPEPGLEVHELPLQEVCPPRLLPEFLHLPGEGGAHVLVRLPEFRMLLDLLAIKWRKEVVVFSLLGGLFDLVLGFLLAFLRLFVPSLVLVGVRVLLLGPGRSVLGLVGVGVLRGVLGVGLGRLGFGRRPREARLVPARVRSEVFREYLGGEQVLAFKLVHGVAPANENGRGPEIGGVPAYLAAQRIYFSYRP